MENLDQVVSDLRAGCDYRLKDGKMEKTEKLTTQEVRQHLSVYEMFKLLGIAEGIMKKRDEVLKELQLLDEEMELHLAKAKG